MRMRALTKVYIKGYYELCYIVHVFLEETQEGEYLMNETRKEHYHA